MIDEITATGTTMQIVIQAATIAADETYQVDNLIVTDLKVDRSDTGATCNLWY